MDMAKPAHIEPPLIVDYVSLHAWECQHHGPFGMHASSHKDARPAMSHVKHQYECRAIIQP